MIPHMGDRTIEISSRQNPWIRRFARAVDRHADEIVMEGPRFVADALARGITPIAVAVRADLDPAPFAGTTTLLIEPRLFDEVSDAVTSQGVVGLFERPENAPEQLARGRRGPVVVLDGIQDPGNAGTIVRLAAAFEAAGVVTTNGSADPWGPKAIRASAGAVLSVPVFQIDAAALPAHFELWGGPVFFADASGNSGIDLPSDGVLLLGSEGRGVSPQLRASGTPIAVRMSPRVESLNVAAAAAILLSRSWTG